MAGPYKDPAGLKAYYDQQAKDAQKAGDQKKATENKQEADKMQTYINGLNYNKQKP